MKTKHLAMALAGLLVLPALGPVACKKKKKSSPTVVSGPDTTPPVVTNTSPNCNQTISGTVMLTANADDNVGVTKVEFFAASNLVGTDTERPYEMSFNASGISGPITIRIKAYDAMGNNATSECNMTGDGPVRKRVFLTSNHVQPNFGGLSGANAICANFAAAAGFPTPNWTAWLSDSSTDALNRIADVGPWYLMDQQTVVFANKAAILSGPSTAILITETGREVDPSHTDAVRTGTRQSGLKADNTCNDWTDASDTVFGQMGNFRTADPKLWTENNNQPCVNNAHLYCFEQ